VASARSALGVRGEALVATHLEQQGFAIVGRNVRASRFELDLVALRDRLLVICEVRTRASRAFVDPILTIDRAKRDRVRSAARAYVAEHGFEDLEIRFDAASVILNEHESTISYYEAAF
jgi:putative endonuclease